MHQKPQGVYIGHFVLAVLHVGSKRVVLQYDGKKNNGLPKMTNMSVDGFDLAAERKGYSVAEVRCVCSAL
jgi:hypothetical protein